MKRRKYPQPKKRNACVGKVQYTRKEAFEAACSLKRQTGETVNSYKCKWCRHFHVGHTPYIIRRNFNVP